MQIEPSKVIEKLGGCNVNIAKNSSHQMKDTNNFNLKLSFVVLNALVINNSSRHSNIFNDRNSLGSNCFFKLDNNNYFFKK